MRKFRLEHLFIGVILLVACEKRGGVSEAESKNSVDYTVAGTELEMVEELNLEFALTNPVEKQFALKGKGKAVNLEDFIHKEVSLVYSSRRLTKEELKQCEIYNVDPVEAIIGMDAVAIITHPKLGVDSLSIVQLQKIYQGKITNWSQVGGADWSIHLYSSQENSATYDYMRNRVALGTNDEQISSLATAEEMIDAIQNDPSGIGYVGVRHLTNSKGKPEEDVWATYLYIEGDVAHSPYEKEAVQSGEYPLSRPLYQYYDGAPKGSFKKFMDFILSDEGQAIVDQYFDPINDYHKQLNAYNGIHASL